MSHAERAGLDKQPKRGSQVGGMFWLNGGAAVVTRSKPADLLRHAVIFKILGEADRRLCPVSSSSEVES